MAHNYLEEILIRKQEEIKTIVVPPSLKKALKQPHLTVIAEIKRKSPSKGNFAPIADPVVLAAKYIEGGASVLSILTDGPGFGGSLEDLKAVAQAFPGIPIMRKDFILDPKQLKQSARAGATAVLLITGVLKDRLPHMIQSTHDQGLEALVEVENEAELQLAIHAGAQVIGVNSRDLMTFHVDLNVPERLSKGIPSSCIKVAESGIHTLNDAQRMRDAGYDAILVGEALVLHANPHALIEEFCRPLA
jgi:indole-3-glycerol phosphate synthase